MIPVDPRTGQKELNDVLRVEGGKRIDLNDEVFERPVPNEDLVVGDVCFGFEDHAGAESIRDPSTEDDRLEVHPGLMENEPRSERVVELNLVEGGFDAWRVARVAIGEVYDETSDGSWLMMVRRIWK